MSGAVVDREKMRGYQRAWEARHREVRREKQRAWRAVHPGYGREYQRKWRIANPDLVAANNVRRRPSSLVYQRKRHLLLRAVADGELARGCMDCGEKDLTVLQFDHVRGKKTANVSLLVTQASVARLYAEIDKCEVRCANCHQRATTRRRAA